MTSQAETYDSHFESAEEARKAGEWERAAGHYADAIRQVEQRGTCDPASLSPEPYRKCAKMLYHVGEDDVALNLLDRFLSLTERAEGAASDEIGDLRERLADEEMQRQPWRYEES